MSDTSAHHLDLDLEQFRLDRKLSYRELAELIGACNATVARRWALGIQRPGTEDEDRIVTVTKVVTVYAMHRRRMTYLRDSGRLKSPPIEEIEPVLQRRFA